MSVNCTPASFKGHIRSEGRKGNEAFSSGDFDKAISAYSEVLRLQQRNHAALVNRCLCFLRLGRNREALQDAASAVNVAPGNQSFYLKGQAHAALGQYKHAEEAFRTALPYASDKSRIEARLEEISRLLQKEQYQHGTDSVAKTPLRASQHVSRTSALTPRSPTLPPRTPGFAPRTPLLAPRTPNVLRLNSTPLQEIDGCFKRKSITADFASPSPSVKPLRKKQHMPGIQLSSPFRPSPVKSKLVIYNDLADKENPAVVSAPETKPPNAIMPPTASTKSQPQAAVHRKRPMPSSPGAAMSPRPSAPLKRSHIAKGANFELDEGVQHATQMMASSSISASTSHSAFAPSQVSEELPMSTQMGPTKLARNQEWCPKPGVLTSKPVPDRVINEVYAESMKLLTENKIDSRNCWRLELIERLDEVLHGNASPAAVNALNWCIIQARASLGPPRINFAVASCTLDACAKIYACRVDACQISASKLISTLSTSQFSGKENELPEGHEDGAAPRPDDDLEDSDSENDGEVMTRTVVKRRAQANNTLEENISACNLKKVDVSNQPDPLFSIVAAKFDEGGAKGLLLNNVMILDDCRLTLDSDESILATIHAALDDQAANCDIEDLQGRLQAWFPYWKSAIICPSAPPSIEYDLLGGPDLHLEGEEFFVSSQSVQVPLLHEPNDVYIMDGGNDDDSEPDADRFDDVGMDAFSSMDPGIDMPKEGEPPSGLLVDSVVNTAWRYSLGGEETQGTESGEVETAISQQRRNRKSRRINAMVIDFSTSAPPVNFPLETGRLSTGVMSAKASRDAELQAPELKLHAGWLDTPVYDSLFFHTPFLRSVKEKDEIVSAMGDAGDDYEVERIVAQREIQGKKEYFVKWWGYPEHENSWIGEEHTSCPQLIADFKERNKWSQPSPGEGPFSTEYLGVDDRNQDDDSDVGGAEDYGYPVDDNRQGDVDAVGAVASDGSDALKLLSPPRRVQYQMVSFSKQAISVDVHRLKRSLWQCLDKDMAQIKKGEEAVPDSRTSFKQAMGSVSKLMEDEASKLTPAVCFVCLLHLANEKELHLRGMEDFSDIIVGV
mmetsp:Transcript_37151/g.61595  ORF Transcript_37151/g.61595 Transcript_37151/m.61595 type:complete len:1069 (-) Transcript_37151:268-3474(-)